MKNTKTKHQNKHIPVLLEEVLKYLSPKAGESYLDLTAGYGGHARTILESTKDPAKAVLVDRDKNAVQALTQEFGDKGAQIIQKDFLSASSELLTAGKRFDLILADLGVSSPHLDQPVRGFSIQGNGPLDMRMDQEQELTADQIVNSYEESELAKLIWRYGEEPRAKKLAKVITENRPIHTTHKLASVIASVAGRGKARKKIHPATRTFQALRLAVNAELEQLEQAFSCWLSLLAPGGRIAVISFHSLEDRIVKQTLAESAGNRYDATLKLMTKQPVMASEGEIVLNPRARSAKLRAAAKIKTNKKGE